MITKPKNAMCKRNHEKIEIAVRSPILKALRDRHYQGGVMTLLSDEQIVALAEYVTVVVMKNERIRIILKRSKQ
jgi:hypothetical protein